MTPKQYATKAALIGLLSPALARQHIKSRPATLRGTKVVCNPNLGRVAKVLRARRVW